MAAHAPAARHACVAGLAELPDLPSAIACARTADLINAHTVLVGFGLNPLRDPGGDATHAPRADALATAVAPPTQLSAIDDKISTASAPRPPAWAARSARSCHAESELAVMGGVSELAPEFICGRMNEAARAAAKTSTARATARRVRTPS